MGLKAKLMEAATPAWFILVMGLAIALYTGQAEPYVSPSQLPGGPLYMFGGAVVAFVAGLFVISSIDSRIKSGQWKQVGKQANLTPERGGALSGKPDLTGTVDGRPVRARTLSRTRHGSGDYSSPTTDTFTLVETDLDRPSEQGLIIAPDGGKIVTESSSISIDAEAAQMHEAGLAVLQVDDVTIVGHDEIVARKIATGRSGDALQSLEANLVYIGDATRVVNSYLQNAGPEDSGLGNALLRKMARREEGAFDDRIPGDGSTVSIEAVQFVTDSARLREWTEAVVDIAEGYEEATTET